ncbi:hypothetical protein AB0L00_06540 [Actinoallomurus sp. NPDC052308]
MNKSGVRSATSSAAQQQNSALRQAGKRPSQTRQEMKEGAENLRNHLQS